MLTNPLHNPKCSFLILFGAFQPALLPQSFVSFGLLFLLLLPLSQGLPILPAVFHALPLSFLTCRAELPHAVRKFLRLLQPFLVPVLLFPQFSLPSVPFAAYFLIY